ncbi:hypothetical protein BDR26DRAFT_860037 [Obelidium mucronatum]|nr:hypothetical protein BDR26DRAFT_860037 [Obelidium mucronatum]
MHTVFRQHHQQQPSVSMDSFGDCIDNLFDELTTPLSGGSPSIYVPLSPILPNVTVPAQFGSCSEVGQQNRQPVRQSSLQLPSLLSSASCLSVPAHEPYFNTPSQTPAGSTPCNVDSSEQDIFAFLNDGKSSVESQFLATSPPSVNPIVKSQPRLKFTPSLLIPKIEPYSPHFSSWSAPSPPYVISPVSELGTPIRSAVPISYSCSNIGSSCSPESYNRTPSPQPFSNPVPVQQPYQRPILHQYQKPQYHYQPPQHRYPQQQQQQQPHQHLQHHIQHQLSGVPSHSSHHRTYGPYQTATQQEAIKKKKTNCAAGPVVREREYGRREQFSAEVTRFLISKFNLVQKPSIEEIRAYAEFVGKDEKKIQKWFQNRRRRTLNNSYVQNSGCSTVAPFPTSVSDMNASTDLVFLMDSFC